MLVCFAPPPPPSKFPRYGPALGYRDGVVIKMINSFTELKSVIERRGVQNFLHFLLNNNSLVHSSQHVNHETPNPLDSHTLHSWHLKLISLMSVMCLLKIAEKYQLKKSLMIGPCSKDKY